MPTTALEESAFQESIGSPDSPTPPCSETSRPWKAVVFDFDGTLADSFPRVLDILPHLARELRFKAPDREEILRLREMSSPQILSRLGISWWKVPILLWRARAMLRAGSTAIPLFPGVPQLLRSLDAAGIEWGILTSNHHAVVRRSLELAGAPEPGWLESGSGLSNKAGRLKRMARFLDCLPREMVMVADETRDVEAALEAGVAMIGVDWGYSTPESLVRHGVDLLAKSREDLSRMLGLSTEAEPTWIGPTPGSGTTTAGWGTRAPAAVDRGNGESAAGQVLSASAPVRGVVHELDGKREPKGEQREHGRHGEPPRSEGPEAQVVSVELMDKE